MALPARRNSARRRAVPAHPPKHAAAAVRAPANPRRSTPVIDFKAVEKRYDVGAIGLDQATFSVQRGEFVFLVGSTGSGKSTIMRLLIKELEPSGGRIVVAGRDLEEITRRRVPYYRRNIGVVFQDFKLLPNRTVYDNVAYALQVTGGSRKEIRAKVPDILRLTGLSTKLHNYPDQLSGGEQQRVSVARAFVNHPPLLLADEPTGNLDPETSIGIMQLLYRINKTGTTVLVATHDHRMVDKMRRRVIELSRGRIVRDEATGLYARDESTREFAARLRSDAPVAPETMAVEAGRMTQRSIAARADEAAQAESADADAARAARIARRAARDAEAEAERERAATAETTTEATRS
jgi:cell division transport system ATP-binding protein